MFAHQSVGFRIFDKNLIEATGCGEVEASKDERVLSITYLIGARKMIVSISSK